MRKLKEKGYENLVLRTRSEVDLLDQGQTFDFLKEESPDCVVLAAAKVGGIKANIASPADFLYQNLEIQNNVIEGARLAGVGKLLFTASSCIYPKAADNPIQVESLMTGPLEPTNKGYALAKLAGIEMCGFYQEQYGCDYFSVIPCNLFGPGDNYDPLTSHLLPALIHKIHQAKLRGQDSIQLWGTGRPRREFMLSDDCAEAMVFLLENYRGKEPINIGTREDHSILELAEMVSEALEHQVTFEFDPNMPDGMMKKLVDSSELRKLGWANVTPMNQAIRIAYEEYLSR